MSHSILTYVLLSARNDIVAPGPSIFACCSRDRFNSDSRSSIDAIGSNFSGVRAYSQHYQQPASQQRDGEAHLDVAQTPSIPAETGLVVQPRSTNISAL